MNSSIRLTLLSKSAAESRGNMHLDPGPKNDTTIFVSGGGDNDYACGKCGALLMSNVAQPMFANGALRCNSCGKYSDGLRPAKYSVPTMRDDVDSLRKPKETYPRKEKGKPCPQDDLLDRLHDKFVCEWQAAQGDRPRKLYHYTTFEGLQGVLKTNQLWVTDVAYLNDSLEMQLGFSTVEDALQEKEGEVSEICRSLLKRSRISGSPTDPGTGYYVACFCEERDLLSQWRAYAADGGGYAIGFSAYEMAYEGHVALRRVIYDRHEQERLVKETIDRICSEFEEVAKGKSEAELDDDHTLPSFAQLLASHLSEFLVSFKHHTFEAEQEWRIILPWAREAHLNFVNFRASRGHAVPYMALHPRTPTQEMPLLPVIEIVHGPTLHPELTKKSVHLLLQKSDYDHVEVDGSRVPLRA